MGATRGVGFSRAFCIQRERPAAPASTPENAAAGWPDAPPRRASESTVSHELRTRAVRVCIRQPTHKDFDGDAYCIQSQCPCKTPAEISRPAAHAGRRTATCLAALGLRSARCLRHSRACRLARPKFTDTPSALVIPSCADAAYRLDATGVHHCGTKQIWSRQGRCPDAIAALLCLSHASFRGRIATPAALYLS
jgi:hypothetical protein